MIVGILRIVETFIHVNVSKAILTYITRSQQGKENNGKMTNLKFYF